LFIPIFAYLRYNSGMDADQIRQKLLELQTELAELRIESLAVFGSVSRGQAVEGSDLDFLVEFEGMATFDRYMDLRELLERTFGVPIDLVTVRALKPLLRDQILSKAVKVA
jgi:predicted nucleotidyltransferase